MTTAKTRAEMQFAAIQRQAKRAQTEHELELQERAEHIARLRALRLAKEAKDKERAKTSGGARSSAVKSDSSG